MIRLVSAVSAVALLAGTAGAQSFSEGFETVIPTGWVNVVANPPGTNPTWFQGNTGVFPAHAGPTNSYAAANYQATTGTNTISLWLMSPVRTFNNGDTISFYTRTVNSPAFPDRLHLKVSLNDASTAPGDFGITLVTVNAGLTTAGYPTAWTQFTGTISGLGSPTSGRFAFHYDVPNGGPSGANSDYIGVDTCVYTAIPTPGALALLGLGGLAASRRRR